MKYLKLFGKHTNIDGVCKRYNIRNYTINPDGSIDVNEDVRLLSNNDLEKLPVKFRNVTGHFYCSSNQLTSLEGAPQSVGGSFYCRDNQLTTLEGAPQSVGGNFNFINNQLTTLEGVPQYVGGDFYCSDNKVYSIWKLFEDFNLIELFNDYDIIRGDRVDIQRLNSFLVDIGKSTVEKVAGYINI